MASRKAMYLSIEADVLTVDIGEDVRLQKHVVQRCVKRHLLGSGPPADLDLAQPAVPHLVSLLTHLIEVTACILLIHIGPGIRNTDKGESNLNSNGGILTLIKVREGARAWS